MTKELELIAECQFDGWGHRLQAGAWETFVECTCGWTQGFPSTSDMVQIKRIHAAHVVSRLSEHGYSIVATTLLSELTDPDPCWFDHNGGCQAHGFISLEQGQTCPVHDAKQILAAAAAAEEAVADPDETAGQYMHRTGNVPPWWFTAAAKEVEAMDAAAAEEDQ